MRLYVLTFFVLICGLGIDVQAQQPINHHMGGNLFANTDTVYARILNRASKQLNSKSKKYYATYFSTSVRELYENGIILTDMPDLEQYLNDILDRIRPDSIKQQRWIHVYVSGLLSPNAFCLADGSILFNVGLFQIAKTESAIAAILGHELMHYLNNDCESAFLTNVRAFSALHKTLPFYGKLDYLNYLSYSREQETVADSIGSLLALNVGYDIRTLFQIYSVFQGLEVQLSESDALRSERFSTHPLISKRRKTISAILETKSESKRSFVVSEQLFKRLQQRTMEKTVELCLQNGQFHYAVESAFKLFLLYDNKPGYALLCADAIRQLVGVSPKVKGLHFLYYLQKQGSVKSASQRILSSPSLLFSDSLELAKALQNNVFTYKDSLKTYDHFFNYFIRLSKKFALTEAILTEALYAKAGSNARTALLKAYIASSDCKYVAYAKALLNDELLSVIQGNANRYFLFDRMQIQELHEEGKYDVILQANQVNQSYSDALHNLIKMIGYPCIFSSINEIDTFYYQQNLSIKQHLMLLKNKKNALPILFELSPDLWNYMHNNQISSIEYLKVSAIRNRQLLSAITLHYMFGLFLWPYDLARGTFKGSYCYKFSYEFTTLRATKTIDYSSSIYHVGVSLNEHTFKNVFYHFLTKLKKSYEK